MRTVRNITVAVDPELYRQTRKIAADYDTTVTDMVRFLLLVLPEAVKAARYPRRPAAIWPGGHARRPHPERARSLSPGHPLPGKERDFALYTCKPHQALSPQQLAGQQSPPVQNKYLSKLILKSLIKKALRPIS